MLLHQLLNAIPVYQASGSLDIEIANFTADSRKVTEDTVFVAIKGNTFDGHTILPEIIQKGAVACIVEQGREIPEGLKATIIKVKDTRRVLAILADRFYHQPSHKLQLIGVTGTNGKTTTTSLIHRILTDCGHKVGLIGTIQMLIGEESEPVKNTTPESIDLHHALYRMVEAGCSYAVMEVSSHALDLGRVRGAHFASAIFTNLTQDHLDYHKTMEEYKRVKGLFFSQLGNDYGDRVRPAILNADDPASAYYARITAAPVITYGINHEADVRATNIEVTANGLRFWLDTWRGSQEVILKLIGRFNVYNALAAITATLVEDIPLESIIASLSKIPGVNGRFEQVSEGQNYTVIVDYAHTPDSLENVLQTIQQFAKGNVTCVVGCGGDRDRSKRPIMAKIAAQLSNHVILTSDNPRTEDPLQILRDMEQGLKEANVSQAKYSIIEDRKTAIHTAIANAQKNDVILIAGKGHETYQIIGKEVHHFDDREVAREAIRSQKS